VTRRSIRSHVLLLLRIAMRDGSPPATAQVQQVQPVLPSRVDGVAVGNEPGKLAFGVVEVLVACPGSGKPKD
jgi:hypothetical protein